MKKTTLSLVAMLTATASFAQLSIDANLKTRLEYNHGQGSLITPDTDPSVFVSQRTRLGVNYKRGALELQTSIQDVSVWGDAGQPGKSTDLGIFEAWAKLGFNDNASIKLGRQVLSYDDQRILGGLDWAQSGRVHDAALLSYNKNGFKADAGFAYNQDKTSRVYMPYTNNSYKTMQFLHLNNTWEGNTASFLFMNNGFQNFVDNGGSKNYKTGTFNIQTLGAYGKFSLTPEMKLEGSAYYQMGKREELKHSAYQVRAELGYIQPSFNLALGAELLSGTSYDADRNQNNTFSPLYGTNHAFNGFMDYFYVGENGTPAAGLNDFYGKASFNLGGDANMAVRPHIFMSNAQLGADVDSYLGTEVDVVYSNKIYKDVDLNVGYSHMFASESMEYLKGGSHSETNNWFWVQLYFRPNLFNSSK